MATEDDKLHLILSESASMSVIVQCILLSSINVSMLP